MSAAATSTDASNAQPTGPASLRKGATLTSRPREIVSKHWARIARVTASSKKSLAALANLPANTTRDGLINCTALAIPKPNASPASHSAVFARGSPRRAAETIISTVSWDGAFTRLRSDVFAPFSSARRTRATVAPSDANASTQPRLPQAHSGPLRSITMCPISPPASVAPRSILPPTKIPAPIPVPIWTYIAERWRRFSGHSRCCARATARARSSKVISVSKVCLLCRSRHSRHYAEFRTMPSKSRLMQRRPGMTGVARA